MLENPTDFWEKIRFVGKKIRFGGKKFNFLEKKKKKSYSQRKFGKNSDSYSKENLGKI
jgi:hypothetical protein